MYKTNRLKDVQDDFQWKCQNSITIIVFNTKHNRNNPVAPSNSSASQNIISFSDESQFAKKYELKIPMYRNNTVMQFGIGSLCTHRVHNASISIWMYADTMKLQLNEH